MQSWGLWQMTPGLRLWHVPQPTVPWCPHPVPAEFSPAVKTFSQKAKAVPGLRSSPSDIAGKDPVPQIPSTHVAKSQGFTNGEKMLPPTFCPPPEQPNISLSNLSPPATSVCPGPAAALLILLTGAQPWVLHHPARPAQGFADSTCSRRIWKPFSPIILKSSNKQTMFSPARSFFFILLT